MTTSSNYFGEKEWLISPLDTVVFTVRSSGSVNTWNVKGGASVRPTFYLTSSTYITDGEGSISNPYQIDFAINPYIEVKPEYKDGLKKVYDGLPLTIENQKKIFNYYPKNATISCGGTITEPGSSEGYCTLTCNYNGNIINKTASVALIVDRSTPNPNPDPNP